MVCDFLLLFIVALKLVELSHFSWEIFWQWHQCWQVVIRFYYLPFMTKSHFDLCIFVLGYQEILMGGFENIITGRSLTLHGTDPTLIPCIPYGAAILTRSDLKRRARNKFWSLSAVALKQINKYAEEALWLLPTIQ